MEEVQFQKPRRARGTPTVKFVFKLSGYMFVFGAAVWQLLNWYSEDHINKEIATGRFLDSKRWVEKRSIMNQLSMNPIYTSKQIRTLKFAADVEMSEGLTEIPVPGMSLNDESE